MRHAFDRFARATSHVLGLPSAFIVALLIVIAWAATGPALGYSDTWQLIINTSTTVLTFLMIFVLQSTQNRDTTAVQKKLDEILRAVPEARDDMIGIEQEDES